MPFSGTKTQSTFTVRLWNSLEAFLSGTHNGWEDHHNQSQTSGKDTLFESNKLNKEQHTNQTKNDRWNTGQDFSRKLDECNDFSVFGIFCQIDCRTYP